METNQPLNDIEQYIMSSRSHGISDDQIREALRSQSWREEDISMAFSSVSQSSKTSSTVGKNTFNKWLLYGGLVAVILLAVGAYAYFSDKSPLTTENVAPSIESNQNSALIKAFNDLQSAKDETSVRNILSKDSLKTFDDFRSAGLLSELPDYSALKYVSARTEGEVGYVVVLGVDIFGKEAEGTLIFRLEGGQWKYDDDASFALMKQKAQQNIQTPPPNSKIEVNSSWESCTNPFGFEFKLPPGGKKYLSPCNDEYSTSNIIVFEYNNVSYQISARGMQVFDDSKTIEEYETKSNQTVLKYTAVGGEKAAWLKDIPSPQIQLMHKSYLVLIDGYRLDKAMLNAILSTFKFTK